MENPFEHLNQRLNEIEALLQEVIILINSSKPPEKPSNDILRVSQAAKFLSLSVPTIYTKVSRGELPVMKRAHRLYFSREDLLDYLKVGRKKTNDEISKEADEYLLKRQQQVKGGGKSSRLA